MAAVPAAVAAEQDGRVQSIRLTIPARAEYISLGRLALTGLARALPAPVSEETLADLKLALTEACTNSVRHAYDGSGGTVEIVFELHPDRLVVEVADEGGGFDPAAAPAPDPDDLAEGGLGIAIIEALSDELEIRERPDRGSTIRFVKLLA